MPHHNITREQIVEEARTWLGTPFKHQGCMKGQRADCIGFIRGIAMELDLVSNIGFGSLSLKPYMGYGKSPVPSKFIGGLKQYLIQIPINQVLPADLLLFRGRIEPSHLVMVTDVGIIHSAADFGKVVEHRMDEKWLSRRLLGFKFPIFKDE